MRLLLNRFLILIVFLLSVSFIVQGKKPFSFVQMADTQLGHVEYARELQSFEQAVKQINALNPDFVVICGDLVNNANDSSYADFKRIREKLKMPCYVASGNHDVKKLPDAASLAYYRNVIGKDYYSFKHKGYLFVVTNTQLWEGDVKDESEKYNNWFAETLKTAAKKKEPVFVIGHSPLYISKPDEKPEYFNIVPEKRKEILALFKENNVVAYLSGHVHKLVVNNYDGIQLVSSETTSNNFDKRPFGFRLWEVSPGSISHRFIPLEP